MANEGYYGQQYGVAEEYGNDQEQDYGEYETKQKQGNTLPVWGNQRTMNINNLILTNIQSSPYFKVKLYGLKTYHEVIDEIYYKIDNLEPWERGSRKTAGQTGMCGGVRGVGTGGIVSTSYCILYKLFTLKLTRKQLNGMLNHTDSPYIRGLGLMYIRYCQPPKDLYAWFEPYLDDEEEIDVKAGGGAKMTIGSMARTLLTKLEWFDTLFPRIPVPIQKQIDEKLKARMMAQKWARSKNQENEEEGDSFTRRSTDRLPSRSRSQQVEKTSKHRSRSRSADRRRSRERSYHRDRDRDRLRHDERSRHSHDDHKRSKRSRSRDRRRRSRSGSPKRNRKHRSRSREHKKHEKKRERSRSGEKSSKKRDKSRSRSREKNNKKKEKSRSRSRERSSKKKEKKRKDRS